MKAINHEYYVSLEVAKLLKEAGFDWECIKYYMGESNLLWTATTSGNLNDNSEVHKGWKSAPTLEVAQRWLREVMKIEVFVEPFVGFYKYVVEELKEDGIYSCSRSESYEEAQEAGEKKALEIILEK